MERVSQVKQEDGSDNDSSDGVDEPDKIDPEIHSGASKFSLRKVVSKIQKLNSFAQVKKTTTETFAVLNSGRKRHYPMERSPRGNALVVTMTAKRDGWQADITALNDMFIYLDVQATYYFDLAHKKLIKVLEAFAASRQSELADCLFVVLMGHGGTMNQEGAKNKNKEFLKTSDGNAFYIQENFKRIFDNHKNRHLMDKPKVFLIQMCRGNNTDEGVNPSKPVIGSDSSKVEPQSLRTVPSFSDYLFSFATQPGVEAFRSADGSWFIQELTKLFMDQAVEDHVADIITEINEILEEKCAQYDEEGIIQASEKIVCLKKRIYLFPGLHQNSVPKFEFRGIDKKERRKDGENEKKSYGSISSDGVTLKNKSNTGRRRDRGSTSTTDGIVSSGQNAQRSMEDDSATNKQMVQTATLKSGAEAAMRDLSDTRETMSQEHSETDESDDVPSQHQDNQMVIYEETTESSDGQTAATEETFLYKQERGLRTALGRLTGSYQNRLEMQLDIFLVMLLCVLFLATICFVRELEYLAVLTTIFAVVLGVLMKDNKRSMNYCVNKLANSYPKLLDWQLDIYLWVFGCVVMMAMIFYMESLRILAFCAMLLSVLLGLFLLANSFFKARLILDVRISNPDMKDIWRVLALADEGALLVTEEEETYQLIRINKNGLIVKTLFTSDTLITGLISLIDDELIILQADGTIRKLRLGDGEKLFHHKAKVTYLYDGIMEKEQLLLVDYWGGKVISYCISTRNQEDVVSDLDKPTSLIKADTDKGAVFVLNECATDRVNVYNSNWGLLRRIGCHLSPSEDLRMPHSAVFTPDRTIMVTDFGNNRVCEFSLDGRFIRQVLQEHHGLDQPERLSLHGYRLWICTGVNVKCYNPGRSTRFI